jgi:hypothetical protein
VRFYANSPEIPSSVVTVSSYIELQAEHRIYCRMIRELGHTVDVRKPNLYSAFVHSRPESEQFVHLSEVAYWPEGVPALVDDREPEYKFGFTSYGIDGKVVQPEPPVLKLHEGDRKFLKSLRIAVED